MGGVPLTRALSWTLAAGTTSCDCGFSTKHGGSTKSGKKDQEKKEVIHFGTINKNQNQSNVANKPAA